MYLKNLVDAYPDAVHVVGPFDDDADSGEEGITRGSRRYMVPTRATSAMVLAAAERFSPDAILFGAPHPLASLGPKLRRQLGIPFGILSHGAEITLPGAVPGVRQVLGRSLASADVRFAVSRYTARRVRRISGKSVEFLGSGVETATFTPPQQPHTNTPPVVGCVSRFVPRKGQHRLIEAVSRLDWDVELLIVGTGRMEKKLRRLARSLDVRVTFAVDVPWSELPGMYQRMDVFCMPCRSRMAGLEVEGLGIVFLEAASCGVPVLVGDSGGSPETVLPGETGFVVSDIAAIVEGLEILLSDLPAARKMGAQGRRFVEDNFVWPRVIERLYAGFAPYVR